MAQSTGPNNTKVVTCRPYAYQGQFYPPNNVFHKRSSANHNFTGLRDVHFIATTRSMFDCLYTARTGMKCSTLWIAMFIRPNFKAVIFAAYKWIIVWYRDIQMDAYHLPSINRKILALSSSPRSTIVMYNVP